MDHFHCKEITILIINIFINNQKAVIHSRSNTSLFSLSFLLKTSSIADHLSVGVAHKFRETDVFLTSGGNQALHVSLTVLATPGCNILLPRPGFPLYESACDLLGIEPRYYTLLPTRSWEIDLDQVKSLADSNTVGIVVINPNNPCGAVYSSNHLHQVNFIAVCMFKYCIFELTN